MAMPASRLVLFLGADLDDRIVIMSGLAVNESLRPRRRSAADLADGIQLCDEFRPRQEFGHNSERLTPETLVQAGNYHPHAFVRQILANMDYFRPQKLNLVNGNRIGRGSPQCS